MTVSDDTFAVIRVINRYGLSIDSEDWDLFRTLFTEDVHADYGDYGVWEGVDAFTAEVAKAQVTFSASQHFMSNHDVIIDGDLATCRSYINGVIVVRGTPGGDSINVRGYYVDQLVRMEGAWRIKHRRFRGTWYEGNLAIFGYDDARAPLLEQPPTTNT
jgi:hypothetical protein